MKVGLFFGSFNPIHVGHLIIASFMADETDLGEVWMVVTPHNPLKKRSTLANDYDRLYFVEQAVAEHPKLKSSDIEFGLPKPSYTVDTLAHLSEKHPEHEFVLIMGGDNIATLHKWKNYEYLLANYQIYVYKRPSYVGELETHSSVHIFHAPQMEISSTVIRKRVKDNKSVRYWVPDAIVDAVESNTTYQQ